MVDLIMFKVCFVILGVIFLIVFFCFVLLEGNLIIGLIILYSCLVGGSWVVWGRDYVFVMIVVVDNINKDLNFLFGICFGFIWNDLECIEEKLI